MDAKIKIKNLIKKLLLWEYEYYHNSLSLVPDFEYDLALQELIMLESQNPKLKFPNSPSQRVGGFVSSKFYKVKHSEKMLSLSNAFDFVSVNKFNEDIKKITSEINGYVVEPKIDGLSIALIYENGYLSKALTRGDGEYGEDVTNNAKTIKDIPLEISYKNQIEIRGEIYLSIDKFKELNKNVEVPFANPRNAASGSMRNLDSSVVAKRKLNCFAYIIVNPKNHKIKTQLEVIEFLRKLKFRTAEIIEFKKNIQDVWNKIQEIEKMKSNLNYECDGVVVKYNDLSKYDLIGYTSKFPKWATAYKFPAEIKQSTLNNIILSVGRTGKINYVANIDKIEINGTMVTNATLHNYDYIKNKDIRINDFVNIFKAGEIIPKIISVDFSKRTGNEIIFEIPKNCPSCNSELIHFENEVDLYCMNEHCHQKLIEKINHFCSRNAMNIEGMSGQIITKLYNEKFINSWKDLYELENQKNQIIEKNLKLKDKALKNLITSINNSKKNSLEKLIFGLGIRHVGENGAKKLAKNFLTLEKFGNASFEEILLVNEIGEKMASAIIDFFNLNKIEELIKVLNFYKINHKYKSFDINFEIDENKIKQFYNKKFLITGSFEESRVKIKSLLEDHFQIKFTNSINEKLDFVLAGKKPTANKINRAKLLKIKIITEEFWKK